MAQSDNSNTFTAPQINLGEHINEQIASIEKEQRVENAIEESSKIAADFMRTVKINSSASSADWKRVLMLESSQEKEILDKILEIYINNSNSLDSPSYSLFITAISEKMSNDNFLEKRLVSRPVEVKDQLFLILFKKLHPDYYTIDDYDYYSFSHRNFNLKPTSVDDYILNPASLEKDLQGAISVENMPEEERVSEAYYIHTKVRKLGQLLADVKDLQFVLDSNKRVDFLTNLLSNLQSKLENYIKANPEVFKLKVQALHRQKNVAQLLNNDGEELDKLLAQALEATNESSPIESEQVPENVIKNKSFIKSLKTFFFYFRNQEPPVIKVEPQALTIKEKILMETGKSKDLVVNLKNNALFNNSVLIASLDLLTSKIDNTLKSINLCDEAAFTAIELESHRIVGRTVLDVAATSEKTAKLSPAQRQKIMPEIEKMLLSAIELSTNLDTDVMESYANAVEKEAQVSAKLASIRSQAQNSKTMSLGSKGPG